MGYYIRVCGRLHLDPPIEFETEEKVNEFDGSAWIVGLEPIIIEYSDIWVCFGFKEHGEPSMLHNFESQIKDFLKRHPGRKFKGVLHFEGEDQGDTYQWFVDGDTIIRRDPEVKWPDPPAGFEEFKEYYDR